MSIERIHAKRILLSPLNWGQGHVYRLLSLAQTLIAQNNTLFIACNAQQKRVFEYYLGKEVTYFALEGYKFQFSINHSLVLKNVLRSPALYRQYLKDHHVCEDIVMKEKIDLVISDHRYGFYARNVTSIFMTHQCQLPTTNRFVQALHHRLINKHFSSVWIIDDENNSLAGKLSIPINIKIPTAFIGALSRFKKVNNSLKKEKIVAVISGPAPYNQLLLNAVKEYAERNKVEIQCVTHLKCDSSFLIPIDMNQQDDTLSQANTIISHCGYSTLMDLHYLQPKKAILIPTPKQEEQQYLAIKNKTKYTILKEYKDLVEFK